MQKNKIGPLLTLAAVAAVGGGLWLANVSQETESATPATPVAQSLVTTTASSPAPPPPSTAPLAAFPTKANYVGKIPTAAGVITLEVTIDGQQAIAYACDGNAVEVWLRGSATNGELTLANKDQTSRLSGRLDGASIGGSLTIGAKSWDFTAAPVEPPAGLYVYEEAGLRNSWIVDSDGAVTGVQRRADGSLGPASALTNEGTAIVDGVTVTAVKVEGDDDVE